LKITVGNGRQCNDRMVLNTHLYVYIYVRLRSASNRR